MGAPYTDKTIQKKRRLVAKLKRASKEAGHTSSDVARELDIDRQTVRNWFAGKHLPYAAAIVENVEALIACYATDVPAPTRPSTGNGQAAPPDLVKALLKHATAAELLAELTRRAS